MSSTDVEVRNEGSIVAFDLRSQAAKEWVWENVESEGWQWMGAHTLCVDWRYAEPLVDALRNAGLEVE